MDLMLGVAELHTPEAVAAVESAMVGSQQAYWRHIDGDSELQASVHFKNDWIRLHGARIDTDHVLDMAGNEEGEIGGRKKGDTL
ncbi:hypothetical protein NE237_018583 [Protea cynaroides]|uniref:Uncharacterized protein n=1 Tax=Protea cynaroides TaxID=273540 RepID=A0A9Q0QPB3_9MAGN|nr:hypothetical protein NE237_018583 [Protea cynaroides]